jgi:FKBP-type peptidyl-prolyl cis-trans isomerase
MPRRAAVPGTVLLLAALAACTLEDDILDPTEIEYAASLDIDLDRMTRTQSGLYYEDTEIGDGDVAEVGDSVTVFYTGWLPDGSEFDTNRDDDVVIGFTIGEPGIIAGFVEGVLGMREGGARKLVIPPHLGYGSRGRGAVPPNSTLVFEVELVAIIPR